VGAEYPVTVCELGIFADQAAEPVSPQNPNVGARSGWNRTPGRRGLLERPVRAMQVVMVGVFAEDQPVGAGNGVTSGDLGVFVDHAP